MKRITNYALDCLINQGISKEHIKSLIKAIENQTRDNILTPEQAIEILLDGVIYEEELHQLYLTLMLTTLAEQRHMNLCQS